MKPSDLEPRWTRGRARQWSRTAFAFAALFGSFPIVGRLLFGEVDVRRRHRHCGSLADYRRLPPHPQPPHRGRTRPCRPARRGAAHGRGRRLRHAIALLDRAIRRARRSGRPTKSRGTQLRSGESRRRLTISARRCAWRLTNRTCMSCASTPKACAKGYDGRCARTGTRGFLQSRGRRGGRAHGNSALGRRSAWLGRQDRQGSRRGGEPGARLFQSDGRTQAISHCLSSAGRPRDREPR